MKRPESLTVERAFSVLPKMDIDEEWLRKEKAGELPEGIRGLCGCMKTIWPEEKLTEEEAKYILWLEEQMSWRCLADEICEDNNQIYGMHLIEAAHEVLENG